MKRSVLAVVVLFFLIMTQSVVAETPAFLEVVPISTDVLLQNPKPIVVTDRSGQPFFFFVKEGHLFSFKADPQGNLSSVVPTTTTSLPARLSPLQMGTRDGWEPLLAFWGLDGTELSLWTIQSSDHGFETTKRIQMGVAAGADFPAFWVFPYGRLGWLIVWSDRGSLATHFIGFDGTDRSLGNIALGGALENLRLFERQDLDSGEADLIFQTQLNGQSFFQAVKLRGFNVSLPTLLLQAPTGSSSSFELAYRDSGPDYLFATANGSTLSWVTVEQGQVSPVSTKDFSATIGVALRSGPNSPPAVVVTDSVAQRFWWQEANSAFSTGGFRTGILLGPDSPVPLLRGDVGWLFLQSQVADSIPGRLRLTFGRTNSGTDGGGVSLSVAGNGVVWALPADSTGAGILSMVEGNIDTLAYFDRASLDWKTLSATEAEVFLGDWTGTVAKLCSPPQDGSRWTIWMHERGGFYPLPWVDEAQAWGLGGRVLAIKEVRP